MADPAVIPTYMISRFAREHIKVALSGEGSDELFGGYPHTWSAPCGLLPEAPGVVRRQLLAGSSAFFRCPPRRFPRACSCAGS